MRKGVIVTPYSLLFDTRSYPFSPVARVNLHHATKVSINRYLQ